MSINTSRIDTPTMAVFCDFENVALGVRDAHLPRFDIQRVLERLLTRGSIIVKKAYCNWARYAEYRREMHGANFELIEVPGVSQSGKNSADIRMVVDALDLCYTKEHVSTFVLVTGDSDFSPLVSKLRENNKTVLGVGVRNSTSELLVSNCDEFIFYDDLIDRTTRQAKPVARQPPSPVQAKPPEKPAPAPRVPSTNKVEEWTIKKAPAQAAEELPDPGNKAVERAPTQEDQTDEPRGVRAASLDQAFDLMLETLEAVFVDHDNADFIWGSMLKRSMQRRRPDFSEKLYGFRTFGSMLEEAQQRGLIDLEKDKKSGDARILGFGPKG